MVFILDDNSEIGAHEQSLLFHLFKAFDKIESRHKSDIFFRKDLFSFMRAKHVLSYHLR